ncbi:hypothetical protein FA313_35580, partial [Pseudomonas aeruginosa]|nr:hypothetical protein [Pseudomonas aeruginosa]
MRRCASASRSPWTARCRNCARPRLPSRPRKPLFRFPFDQDTFMSLPDPSADGVKFAYWVPNVSGGLVV